MEVTQRVEFLVGNNQDNIFALGHYGAPFLGSVSVFSLLHSTLHGDVLVLYWNPYYNRKYSASHNEFAQSSFWVTICNLCL